MLTALAGDVSDIHSLILEGDPVSKARARYNRNGRVYVSPEARAAEKRTASFLRDSFPEPMTGNIALAAVFYRSNFQRIDVDNMLKHICDSATGIIWRDDSQVTAIVGVAELDPAFPRSIIAVSPHESTLLRGTDNVRHYVCQQCSNPFITPGGVAPKKYCSKDCAYAARVNVRPLAVCRHCGHDFQRTTNRQVLCSNECRTAWLTGRKKASAKPFSVCTQCGIDLTHKRGGRCRDCWRTSPYEIPAHQPALPLDTGGTP
jgi:Holliday junction resolvase RusA-like endonuclease